MQTIQKLRESKLDYDERVDLVKAAKSALRKSGGSYTKFIWHGELFHYGFSSEGLWVIAETDDPGPGIGV